MNKKEDTMEALVALCKRRGFIFPGSDIYGGLAGSWDYGPLGVALKNNIKKIWWKRFVDTRDDMYGVDAAILMNPRAWEASGHVGGFADPMVECQKCKHRFRADHIQATKKKIKDAKTGEIKEVDGSWCPDCEGELGNAQQFNMMFKTHVGASQDSASVSYLRPETAQGMFVNFKNIMDTQHPKLPFGMAQIGKAFRNEIAPRDFLFRSREFEQMEIEYFVDPKDWEKTFEHFLGEMHGFIADVGLTKSKVSDYEVPAGDLAHYSKRTIDIEFEYPFGKKELYGLAYRTDFDLKQHSEYSKVDLSYYNEETKERFVPHCIEPSFGLDRTVLAVLVDAYREDDMGVDSNKNENIKNMSSTTIGDENDKEKSQNESSAKRIFLKLAPSVAPYKLAVFPLLRNKPELVKKAEEIYKSLRKIIPNIVFDDNGNIGKRYRRQDEIGTPYCITVDFDTIEKGTGVTIRDRDTGKQERVTEEKMMELAEFLRN